MMPAQHTPDPQFAQTRKLFLRAQAAESWVVAAGGLPLRVPDAVIYTTECPRHPGHCCSHVVHRGGELHSICTFHGLLPPEVLEAYLGNLS